jgi:hypothetical protein
MRPATAKARICEATKLGLLKPLPHRSGEDRRRRPCGITRRGKALLWAEQNGAEMPNPYAEPESPAVQPADWLRDQLPGLACDIEAAATAEGITPKRLRKAREQLGVRSVPAGRRRWWTLP